MKAVLAVVVALATLGASNALAQNPSSGPYKGIALKRDGTPASGALVGIVFQATSGWDVPFKTVTAAHDGSFDFGEVENSVAMYPITLVLRVQGEGLAFENLWDRPFPREIRANDAAQWSINVVDKAGAPLKGVGLVPRLVVLSNGGAGEGSNFLQIPEELGRFFACTTDDSGHCSIDGLPRGGDVQMSTVDSRFAQLGWEQTMHSTGSGATNQAKLVLTPGASISGKVKYADGRPAAGIYVGAQGAGMDQGWGNAKTGPDGSYTVTRLSPGLYNVALALGADMEREWTARAHDSRKVEEGSDNSGWDFVLERGAVLKGRVIDTDGKPMKDIPIGVYGPAHPQSGAWVQMGKTDADGNYSHRVPAGEQYVYVADSRYSQKSNTTAMVKDGETYIANFTLPIFRVVVGKVVNTAGEPVAGAEVVATTPEGDYRPDGKSTTKADGSFELPGEFAGGTARARVGSSGTLQGVKIADGMSLTIAPEAMCSIEGTVTDAASNGVAGARVLVMVATEDGSQWTVAQRTTDAQGKFSAPGLFPDYRLVVRVEAEGYGPAQLEMAGGKGMMLKPKVALAIADSTTFGVVLDQDGKPVEGAEVRVSGFFDKRMRTDKNGRFLFKGIPRGEVVLYATLGRESTSAVTIQDGVEATLVFRKRG